MFQLYVVILTAQNMGKPIFSSYKLVRGNQIIVYFSFIHSRI